MNDSILLWVIQVYVIHPPLSQTLQTVVISCTAMVFACCFFCKFCGLSLSNLIGDGRFFVHCISALCFHARHKIQTRISGSLTEPHSSIFVAVTGNVLIGAHSCWRELVLRLQKRRPHWILFRCSPCIFSPQPSPVAYFWPLHAIAQLWPLEPVWSCWEKASDRRSSPMDRASFQLLLLFRCIFEVCTRPIFWPRVSRLPVARPAPQMQLSNETLCRRLLSATVRMFAVHCQAALPNSMVTVSKQEAVVCQILGINCNKWIWIVQIYLSWSMTIHVHISCVTVYT